MATAVKPNALFAKLLDALSGKPDVVPAKYRTAAQWAREWGVSPQKAQNVLRGGIKLGMIECRKFKVKTEKSLRPVPHYCEK